MVYSGDYPAASKEEILERVQVSLSAIPPNSILIRFLTNLTPHHTKPHQTTPNLPIRPTSPQSTLPNSMPTKQTRFHLPLSQPPYLHSIHFLPLPSRRLISDGYWTRFTLLGQSLGSVLVCAEGFGVDFGLGLGLRRGLGRSLGRRMEDGGKKGFWPDVFIGESG